MGSTKEVGTDGITFQVKPTDDLHPVWRFSRTLRGKALDTPTAKIIQSYIAAFSALALPKNKSLDWLPRRVRENRSGGHLSKLGMIRAEVMDGEYSTGIHG